MKQLNCACRIKYPIKMNHGAKTELTGAAMQWHKGMQEQPVASCSKNCIMPLSKAI